MQIALNSSLVYIKLSIWGEILLKKKIFLGLLFIIISVMQILPAGKALAESENKTIVDGLSYPMGMDIDSEGNIYVADMESNSVIMFNSEGERLKVWGGEGIVDRPSSINLDNNGNIFVTVGKEFEFGRILKIPHDAASNDDIVPFYESDFDKFEQFKQIIIDHDDSIYALDNGNNKVVKFHADGTIVEDFISTECYYCPYGLAIDDKYIYVIDYGFDEDYGLDETVQYRIIKLLKSDCSLVSVFERESFDNFYKPYSLALDDNGNFYVGLFIDDTESKSMIECINKDGKVIAEFSAIDNQVLKMPSSIFPLNNGYIYVSDSGNNRIIQLNIAPLYFKPNEGVAVNPEHTQITLSFNEDIATADSSGIQFTSDGTTYCPISDVGTVSVVAGKLIVTFHSPLSGINNRIKVAYNAVVDYDNNNLFCDITTNPIDAEKPTVAFHPSNGATGVEVDSNITINLSEAVRKLDNSEVTSSDLASIISLRETNETGAAVPFTATINAEKTQITIDPEAELKSEQVYYVAIAASLEDASDNVISKTSAAFTTQITPVTPAAPSVSANDTTNKIVGANATMEYSVDGGSNWTDYNTVEEPTFTGNQTVEIRVKAEGINPAGEIATISFTIDPVTPAAPSVSVDDTTNKIVGANATMEYSVDGGSSWTDYNPSNEPTFAGDQTVHIRVKADGSNPAGEIRIIEFTNDPVTPPIKPAAPSVSVDDATNKIVGANATMEYSVNGGYNWADYNPSNEPTFAGNQTVLIRAKADGINPAGAIRIINFTSPSDVPVTPVTPPPAPLPPVNPNPAPIKEQITVEVKQGNTDSTVSQITIDRSTDKDGKKTDQVTYQEEKAVETIEKLKSEGKDTARIVIPDADNVVAETTVNIPSKSLDVLAKGEITLQIDTEKAKIDIPKNSLQNVGNSFEEDLYFKLIPIKEQEQKEAVSERAVFEARVINENAQNDISVIGEPVTIETNMPSTAVDITLPLSGIEIPTDPKEREAFLKQLAVYIEHSDGDKELVQGEIIEYKEGILGIRFHITKFSIFTIVKTDAFAKASGCDVLKVMVPLNATVNGTNISATVDSQVSSKTIKVKVSEKATWVLFSDKACKKEILNQKFMLRTGKNKAYLKVTAENGTEKIYTVTITRKKSSAADIIKVNVPQDADIKGNNITAFVADERYVLAVKVTTSAKATWKLYSDKNCTKLVNNQQLQLKEGTNFAYLKVTAEDGITSRVYQLKITFKTSPEIQYATHVKLGLIGDKAYAEKVAKIFEQDYECGNVIIKKQGKYYRIYLDFTDKATAKAACQDMITRNYIINYYYYTK